MPHTWIVWGRYAKCVQPHSYTRNECCSLSFGLENCQILLEGLRKHFLYVCYLSNSITNIKTISETNNTLVGHCLIRIQKNASRKHAKGEIGKAYLFTFKATRAI